MAQHLKVTYHDNRGGRQHPYGFVYFNDETRVGYAPDVPKDDPRNVDHLGPYMIFPGNWGYMTPAHVRLAEKYLSEVFPHVLEEKKDHETQPTA